MSIGPLKISMRAIRILPLLLILCVSIAAAWDARPNAPAATLPSAAAAATPAVAVAPPTGSRTRQMLAPGIYLSTPFGYTVNWPEHDVTVSICDNYALDSHSVTSPTGVVIEDAAADCPWGQLGVAYFVRWAEALNNPMEIGDNEISVSACDQYSQCSYASGSIKYFPPIDSIKIHNPAVPLQIELGATDTMSFIIENYHASEDYEFNDNEATCLLGLGNCAIVGDAYVDVNHNGSGDLDTLHVRIRGDSVGPRAVTIELCRGFLICSFASQTIAVMPPTPVAAAVIVTGDSVHVKRGKSASISLPFRVQNTGTVATTYSLQATCDTLVIASGCTAASTTTIAAGATTTITMNSLVTATWSGGSVRTGAVRLTARAGVANATGQTAVTASSAGGTNGTAGIVVSTGTVNPAGSVARDQCLMMAAGDAAGVECGDLRLAHGLAGLQALAKSRAATMLYLSRHAEGVPLLYANVRTTHTTPTTLTAKLTINSVTTTRTITWPTSCREHDCRIALPVKPSGTALATGWYHYDLQVRHSGDTTITATDSGSIAVVNRTGSPFGRGWWLEGYEQIVHLADTTRKLWVGGDGSTRLYKKPTVGSSTYVSVYPVARPDTLSYSGSHAWRRRLPNGAYVRFDNSGRHTQTINATGHVTTFTYDGSGTLEWIKLPSAGVSSPVGYRFYYTGTAPNRWLDSVVARPDTLASPRTTRFTRANKHITSIRDHLDHADSTVRFGVDTITGRVNWRRNRIGDSTLFTYDSVGAIAQTRRSMIRTSDTDITTNFCATETRSLVQCTWGPYTAVGGVPLHSSVTRVDGPRSGLIDVMTFHLNRFGSPDTLQDPHGGLTRLERSATFPVLVTKTTNPAGHIQQAWYNARGLVDSMRAPGSSDTTFGVTRIAWNSTWSLPDSIAPPLGAKTKFSYVSGLPLVEWQQVGNHDSTRVRFYYENTYWRLDSVVQPGGKERFQYDTQLGNVSRVQSANSITSMTRDRWGMDSLTFDGDNLSTADLATTIYRNAAGRVDSTRARSRGFTDTIASTSLPFTVVKRTQIVRNVYDREGNILSVARADSSSDVQSSNTATTFSYDAARRVRRRTEDVGTDSFFYDAAGLEVRKRTGRGHNVLQFYDAMGRLAARLVPEVVYLQENCGSCTSAVMTNTPIHFPYYRPELPGNGQTRHLILHADVETFTYDALGRMLTANNRDARVARSYAPNGAMLSETQRLRPYDPTEIASSTPFNTHVYTQTYEYDVLGRRTKRLDFLTKTQTYTYNDFGSLTRLVDRTTGANDSVVFTFAYDAAGRQIAQNLAGVESETRTYDANGRLATRSGHFDDAYTYDTRGKQITRRTSGYYVQDNDSSFMHYDGFGAVVAVDKYRQFGGINLFVDEFFTDALGNNRTSDQGRGLSEGRGRTRHSFAGEQVMHTWTDRLPLERDPFLSMSPLIKNLDSTWYAYDGSGNQASSTTQRLLYSYTDTSRSAKGTLLYHDYFVTAAAPFKNSRSFYDAAQRLRRFERNEHAYEPWHTVQEYRYDALGRRVMLRTRRDSTSCNSTETQELPACLSTIDRFVWDGDQLVTEIRRFGRSNLPSASLDSLDGSAGPFFGRVRYVHAMGIDDPLLVQKQSDSTFVPLRSGRGAFEVGKTLGNGTMDNAYHWPGRWGTVFPGNDTRIEPPAEISWYGSLLDGKADASGLQYMRNRYYDPASGRFTQRDPIGLAGGINQYGYAGGDPINASDPFGLCPYRGRERSMDIGDCPDQTAQDAVLKAAAGLMMSDKSGAGRRSLEKLAETGTSVYGTDGNHAICQGSSACSFGGFVFINVAEGRSLGAIGADVTHEGRHAAPNEGELASVDASLDFFDALTNPDDRSDRLHLFMSAYRKTNRASFIQWVESERKKHDPEGKP